ncbi:putative mitochondrial protein AtMg00860 [Wolffia australiana]
MEDGVQDKGWPVRMERDAFQVIERTLHLPTFDERGATTVYQPVSFLGFILSANGVAVDPAKIDAIISWPKLKSIHNVRSFIGLATFYRRFIPGFSGITAPITDILKRDKFEWTSATDQAFELLKKHMTEAPVLKLQDFNKVFEVACDNSGVGIGGVLSQEGHPIE